MLKKLLTCRGRDLKILLPKREVHLDAKIDLKELEAEMRPVGTEALTAKNRFEISANTNADLGNRLKNVQLPDEIKEELIAEIQKLKLELEKRGLKLDFKLEKNLQEHLNALIKAVEIGKINEKLLEELKKTETATKELTKIRARQWVGNIESGGMLMGSLVAMPLIAVISAINSVKRVIESLKK